MGEMPSHLGGFQFVAFGCGVCGVYLQHFLRRAQVAAVEASVKSQSFTRGQQDELQALTATGLVAHALSSGDVNSVRDALRRKNLDAPIQTALRRMQVAQRNVRGSEAEKDNIIP